jgi:hypothetical protein
MIPLRYRIRRSLEKNLTDVAAALLARLPAFVYGGALGGTLPVFTYHRVDAGFGDDLARLRSGGYRTAGAAELEEYARTGHLHAPRTVALTFDDGDASLTRVAAPLLETYGQRGIGFVVAGLVPETSNGKLCGWRELAESVQQGVLEIGIHSLFHHHVPVSPEVLGRVDERTPLAFTADVPVPRIPGDAPITLGMPILRGKPRYLARAAFQPAAGALERWAATNGDAPIEGTYETADEADSAVEDDIRRAIDLVRLRCPNPAESHLCYPWYAGDARTDRLALKAGVRMVYGGIHRAARSAEPPGTQRLPSIFIHCLPGKGRQSLPRVLAGNAALQLRRRSPSYS